MKMLLWALFGAAGITLTYLILNWATPQSASEEWLYTLKWINLILIALLVVSLVLMIGLGLVMTLKSRYGRICSILCVLFCCIFFAIPQLLPDYQLMSWQWQYFLSACWALAFLLAGIFIFIVASRTGAAIASILCIIGSLALGIAAMEFSLLFTSQFADGMANLSAKSRYAEQGPGRPEYESWVENECGRKPAPEGQQIPAFHRLASFEKDIFDVRYTFNDKGWRLLPPANPGAQNDLLLFGCSFTFGYGLEDEQTWPWKLAALLGPDWDVENYSANAYSINHLLCMLEHGLIEIPDGVNRYALFLAIDHHLRRNEFFTYTPHYQLDAAGEAQAGGQPRFNWVLSLPSTFNGSQLAREAGSFIIGLAMKQPEKHIPLYLAMIKKSATLLRNKYGTQLIVFLWPDMESLEPHLKEAGIPVLLARPMLPDWDTPEDPGWKYRISRLYEPHPNEQAATELAQGVALYFKRLASSAGQQ